MKEQASAASEPAALAAGLRTLNIEAAGLRSLAAALERAPLADTFVEAATLIAGSAGRVVVSGVGKSGLIGRKIAATLASTGTPALFIHPADASHGDLGMITAGDIVLALSWSGETAELSDIISYCHRFSVPLVAITSRPLSSLARRAQIVLVLPQVEEACPNRLAPTSSTTLQAAIGDALAVALIEARGFSPEDFRVFHPKGQLAAQLLRVGDIMSADEAVPKVGLDATIVAAMVEMTSKRYGSTAIVGDDGSLMGAFTDGDLRRSLTTASPDALVRRYMSTSPLTIGRNQLASEAVAMMNGRNVLQLFVTDNDLLVGIVHLHDILRAGVV